MMLKLNLTTFGFILASGILSTLPAFSQQYAKTAIWKVGGDGTECGNDIQQTTDGGYIMAGYTNAYSNYSNQLDVYIVKMDRLGQTQWTKVIGGPDFEFAHAVRQTTDGGYIVSGRTLGVNSGQSKAIVVKLDSSGNVQWSETVNNGNTTGNSVCQTTDGGYAIAGSSSGDFYVVKLDTAGNVLWSKTIGGPDNEAAESIQQTADGGLILAGATSSFGSGLNDVYVVKLDAMGNLEWTKTIGGEENDDGQSIQQTSDGGFVIGGETETLPNEGGQENINAYIVKLNPSGNLQWAKAYGGDETDQAYSICQAPDGGYITGGYTNSFGSDSSCFYMVKTDAQGALQWTRALPGQVRANVNNNTYGISIDKYGGYIAVGTSYHGYEQWNAFVAKFDASGYTCDAIDSGGTEKPVTTNVVSDSGTVTDVASTVGTVGTVRSGGSVQATCQVDAPIPPTGITSVSATGKFSVYPNPAYNRLVIAAKSTSDKINFVRVTDLTGKTVFESRTNGSSKIILSTRNWANGVYFVEVMLNGKIFQTVKVVKKE